MNRAVGFLQLKALDDDARTFEGWATKTETDRAGDIVESRGATFRLPLPLLLDHRHTEQVGSVVEATAVADGIRFKAKIAKIPNDGPLKQLCDDAWAMVKAGLRRAVSIGFRPLDAVPLPSGGYRYKSFEWYELSLVSIPMLASATIDQVKAYDQALRKKTREPVRVVRLNDPVPAVGSARVVRLDRPVSNAVDLELDRPRDPVKGLRDTEAMFAHALGTTIRTTDECLAQLDARVDLIERAALQPSKSTLEMSPDEYLAHLRAQKQLGFAK